MLVSFFRRSSAAFADFRFRILHDKWNIARICVCLLAVPPLLLFVRLPYLAFSFLNDFVEDNFPRSWQLRENPEWFRMQQERRRNLRK